MKKIVNVIATRCDYLIEISMNLGASCGIAYVSKQSSRQHDGPRNLARISRHRKRKRSQLGRVIIMRWTRVQLAMPAGDAQSRLARWPDKQPLQTN